MNHFVMIVTATLRFKIRLQLRWIQQYFLRNFSNKHISLGPGVWCVKFFILEALNSINTLIMELITVDHSCLV